MRFDAAPSMLPPVAGEPQFDPANWVSTSALPPAFTYHVGGKGRGYYINDQRIEWTGQEATFTTEGVVTGGVLQQAGGWDLQFETEIFLNLPFDRNILNSNERAGFAPNFDVDPLQISQLYLAARKDDWYFSLGRFPTPFGRYYYPIFRNNFDDSPFIRSEAILFRETGLLMQWDPDGFVFTAALTNGGFGQDTNSSKAGILRAGIDRERFACGMSWKVQDGIGSEWHKMYKGHVGVDAMVRWGNWMLSGEAIYDEYGFRDAGFDPNDIFWGRSYYFRDSNRVDQKPLHGFGYYVNLGYEGPRWSLALNYGEYFPLDELGFAAHDTPIHRGLVKASYHLTPNFETYGVALVENSVPYPFTSYSFERMGSMLIFGCQFSM